MPRYLAIPAPINVKLPDGTTKPVSFAEYVLESLGSDPKVAPSFRAVRQLDALVTEIEGASPGAVIALDEDLWERVTASVNEPTGGYNFRFARQMMPFLDALLGATTDRRSLEPKPRAKSNGADDAVPAPAPES